MQGDRKENPSSRFSGEFRWDTMLCRLFDTDIDPKEDNKHSLKKDAILEFEAVTKAVHARHNRDVFFMQHFPKKASSEYKLKLFHERVHYWQTLSNTSLQSNFITSMARICISGQQNGAATSLICGDYILRDIPEEVININENSFKANSYTKRISANMLVGSNPIQSESPTNMPFMMIPHDADMLTPAYGALIEFKTTDICADNIDEGFSGALFPFTGPYLWESAAYLSEQLYAGGKPIRLKPFPSDQDLLYIGAWDFWCRAHSHRYSNSDDLTLSFFAAVDLALTPDVMFTSPPDGEYSMEMTSIPYRFGKIAYRSLGFPPLICGDREPAEAVADWQENFSRFTGWPSPRASVAKMAHFITSLLVTSLARHMEDTTESRGILEEFVHRDVTSNNLDSLCDVWKLIGPATEAPYSRFGEAILGNMLNACQYRLERPGELALPHLYADKLTAAFPLPIVLKSGIYYLDVAVDMGGSGPYPATTARLAEDVISLITLKPMRKGSTICGFIEERSSCWYMKSGLGCPQKELTLRQQEIRRQTGLDDWCHWMMRALAFGTAPEDAQARWVSLNDSLRD